MKKKIVPASLIGQVARCPRAAYYDSKGYKISAEHHERRRYGDTYHSNINQQCKEPAKSRSLVWFAIIFIILIVGLSLWLK